ncbi:235_t:CDS:2 [Entrophospora sp. SA101]|nr:235_t:CDS:2 [Entrophospora sp. SA101]
MVTVKEGDVDIGANPSAEESEEAPLEDGPIKVNNIIHSFRLQETSFDKKAYTTYLKGYMKKLAAHVQEQNPNIDIKEWQKKIQSFSKKIIDNVKDYQFYTGESFNQDGMIALLNYREDGITPYFTFFKDGLSEEKVIDFQIVVGATKVTTYLGVIMVGVGVFGVIIYYIYTEIFGPESSTRVFGDALDKVRADIEAC